MFHRHCRTECSDLDGSADADDRLSTNPDGALGLLEGEVRVIAVDDNTTASAHRLSLRRDILARGQTISNQPLSHTSTSPGTSRRQRFTPVSFSIQRVFNNNDKYQKNQESYLNDPVTGSSSTSTAWGKVRISQKGASADCLS